MIGGQQMYVCPTIEDTIPLLSTRNIDNVANTHTKINHVWICRSFPSEIMDSFIYFKNLCHWMISGSRKDAYILRHSMDPKMLNLHCLRPNLHLFEDEIPRFFMDSSQCSWSKPRCLPFDHLTQPWKPSHYGPFIDDKHEDLPVPIKHGWFSMVFPYVKVPKGQ